MGSGEPTTLPAVFTTFALGDELHNGTSNGPTGLTVHLATDGIVTNAPPTLELPDDMTVDATSPSGATVTYTATATDEDGDIVPECTPPSGSTFAVGTTTVECTATDSAGAVTTGTFLVTVLGAAEQTDELITDVAGSTRRTGRRRA